MTPIERQVFLACLVPAANISAARNNGVADIVGTVDVANKLFVEITSRSTILVDHAQLEESHPTVD